MIQIVLMLFEDLKVDFLFEKCFYVEIYFSFGVKIIDDFEFLVRSFFIRKCSYEDIFQLFLSVDVMEFGYERKCSKIGDVGKLGMSVEQV